MRSDDVDEILARLTLVARPEILRDHLRTSCIASTWITIEVLRQLGVSAQPLEVRLSVGNAEYKDLLARRGRPPRTSAELEDWASTHGAHVIGVGFDPPGLNTIGGHIVAVTQDCHLVDAAIDQVADPAHGIDPPPVLVGFVERGFLMGAPAIQRLDTPNLFVEYVRTVILGDWRSSYDWSGNPETIAAVGRILAAME